MQISIVVFITLILFLLSPQKNLQAQYSAWKTFSTLDGLAGNTVYAMFGDTKGRLWFATDKGVSFYDGISWTTFRVNENCAEISDNNLSNNIVTSIAEDGQGIIWAGTRDTQTSRGCGIKKYDGSEWTTFKTDSGFVADGIYAITMDSRGALWLGSERGVKRYDGQSWTAVDSPDSLLLDSQVTAIIEDRQGALWFTIHNGERDGALRFDGKEWTFFDAENSGLPRYEQVLTIYESHDALWFGTTYGASRFDGEKWLTFTPEDSGIAGGVNAICEGSSGIMWFGTGAGLSRYDGKTWTTFTKENSSLPDNRIISLYKDLNGTLWFGAIGGGVTRYHEDEWITFDEYNSSLGETPRIIQIVEDNQGALWTLDKDVFVDRYNGTEWQRMTSQNSGLADDEVNALSTTRRKEVWFATANGASRFDGQQWTTFNTQNSGLVSDEINTVFEDGRGVLWFGTGVGISRYDGTEWENFTTQNSGLADGAVYQILQDSNGAMWFVNECDINRYDGTQWATFAMCAEAIVADRQGGIWVGTLRDGVSHYDGEKWTNYTTENSGLAGNWVHAILVDKRGELWFATKYFGVSRYDGAKWTTFNAVNSGLIDNQVQTILEDDRGAIWIGSYDGESDVGGVNRYEQGQWLAFTPQNSDSALPSFAVNYIFADSKGFYWFASRAGLTRFKGDDTAPNTEIVGGPQGVLGTSTAVFAYRGGDNFTQINHLLFSTAVVPASRVPLENDWSPPAPQIFAETPVLSNGEYTFYVRARDEFGNVDPLPAKRTFTVDITPPTVTLTSPKAGDVVAGKVPLVGNAFDSSPIRDFARYELKYGFGETLNDVKEWKKNLFAPYDSSKEVFNNVLTTWNTEGLPNGTYWLQLSAYDTLKHESHISLNLEVVKSAATVDSRSGSNFLLDAGKLELYFPPNTFSKEMPLNVRDCTIDPPKQILQATFANLCFELAPRELRLDKPATLTLHYPDSVLNEKKLALFHSTNGKDNWQRLGGSVDVEKDKITTTFKQAGVFALYEDLSTGSKAGIMNVTSQPRVFSPQGGGFNTQTAISFDLGKEANVTIKIYNAAGRLVRVLTENEPMAYGTQVQYWDGKDQSGHYCLSGLHLVTIQAEDKIVTKTVVVLNKY